MENCRHYDISIGTCHCHNCCIAYTGIILTHSSNNFDNVRGDARLYELHIGGCGHTGINISASMDTIDNKRGVTRLYDQVVGCLIGINITGSENTKVNDVS